MGRFWPDLEGVPVLGLGGMGLAKEWAEQQHNISPLPRP